MCLNMNRSINLFFSSGGGHHYSSAGGCNSGSDPGRNRYHPYSRRGGYELY
jgi:hypothetical protein